MADAPKPDDPSANAIYAAAAVTRVTLDLSYERLTAGSKTFRFASYFLPRDCRNDAAVVYSFCRLVDDLADDAPSMDQATTDLQQVRDELQGKATARPIIAAYAQVAARTGISPDVAEALIQGVLSDQRLVRVQTDAELLTYCYQVASTVGLMMCGVLGVRDPRALAHAVDLGLAMQLTNICRDVADDARMNRVYLPEERLRAAGTSAEALIQGLAGRDAIARVVRDLLARAELHYQSADEGMRWIPFRARLAIVIAARTYRAIGLRLLAHGADAMAGRTVVPFTGKVYWAARAMLAFVMPRIQGWLPFPKHDAQLHTGIPPWPGVHASAGALPP
jgi:15-cis-phytoene synthase